MEGEGLEVGLLSVPQRRWSWRTLMADASA
jgi:hypothetical protein